MGLVTIQQIKNNTTIGGNVDGDKLTPLLDDAENLVLEEVLGTALYDKIVTDYNNNNPNNLAGDYATLYNDYIVKILCYLVYADYLRDSIVLAMNTGTFTNLPENAQPSDLDNIKYSAKRYQSKADTYIDRMVRFLCDKNIAEYDNAQANDYDIDPDTNVNNIGGWFLDGGDGETYNEYHYNSKRKF